MSRVQNVNNSTPDADMSYTSGTDYPPVAFPFRFSRLLTCHGLAWFLCVQQGPRTQTVVGDVLALLCIPPPSWAEHKGQKVK